MIDWIVTFAVGETVIVTSCVRVVAASVAVPADVAVTVICALPGDTAVTKPLLVTCATDVAFDENVGVGTVMPGAAVTTAEIWRVVPTAISMFVGWTVRPVNDGGAAVTLIVTPAVNCVVVKPAPDPLAVTVMVAVPGATAVTTPVVGLTPAMAELLVLYAYVTTTAAVGLVTFGTIVSVWPTPSIADVGEVVRLPIAAAAGATLIDAAAAPPFDANAVTVTLPDDTAVTRQAPVCTAAVATAVLLDVHDVSVGGVVLLPPVI